MTAGFDDELPTMRIRLPLPAQPGIVTIGVAIRIVEPWGTQLQRLREDLGDPQAKAIPAHITLLPPTAIDPAELPMITDHLAKVGARCEPFPLRLSGAGTFRPVSPVVFVKVVRGAPGCDALQQSVRTGPLVRDLAYPYHPHVTVAHEMDDPALDRAMAALTGFSATFTVDAFWLYEHGLDGVWRPTERFGFAG